MTQQRIADLINLHAAAEAAAEDWAGVASKLAAATIERRNPKAWTYAELAALPGIGLDGARIVAGTVQAAAAADPLMGPTNVALSTAGMRLDTDERQAMIDTLSTAGTWEVLQAGLTSAVKAAGLQMLAPWQVVGLSAAPDAAASQAAFEQVELEAQFAAEMNDTVNPAVESGRAALIAALQTAAANLGV